MARNGCHDSGREVIDRRANQDADYSQLVRQFERDCQSVLGKDELSALGNSQAGWGLVMLKVLEVQYRQ